MKFFKKKEENLGKKWEKVLEFFLISKKSQKKMLEKILKKIEEKIFGKPILKKKKSENKF